MSSMTITSDEINRLIYSYFRDSGIYYHLEVFHPIPHLLPRVWTFCLHSREGSSAGEVTLLQETCSTRRIGGASQQVFALQWSRMSLSRRRDCNQMQGRIFPSRASYLLLHSTRISFLHCALIFHDTDSIYTLLRLSTRIFQTQKQPSAAEYHTCRKTT